MNTRRLVPLVLATALGVLVIAAAPALAAPQAPKIEEASVLDVAATSATFSATLNPEGAETTYVLEYAPAGGAFAPVPAGEGAGSAGEGTAGVALNLHIQRGLAPGTAYEFRLVASNSVGTVTGEAVPFTTQTAGGAFLLPDGRQYELVTPPQKQGALFEGISPPEAEREVAENREGKIIQASAAGNAIVDLASRPTEAGPQGYSHTDVSVLSTRGASGWSSQVIAPPYAEGTVPVGGDEYALFSQDLSRGILQPYGNFDPLLSPEASESTAYLRTDYLNGNVEAHCQSSCYQPLVTAANTRAGVAFGEAGAKGECAVGAGACGPSFFAATPDMSHVIVSSEAQLTSTPAPVGVHARNLYEWSGGQLQLVSILPGSEEGAEGADRLWPAGNLPEITQDKSARHEISDDGERIFLEQLEGNVYVREVASKETVELDLAEPGCASCVSGGGHFMTASSDGSRVFFLDPNRLTAESSASGTDLYEYDLEAPVGHRLSDLTADPNAGEAADVQTVLGASEDGSYVYFVAGGRLAPGAGDDSGCNHLAHEPCNLYVRHEGVTRFIAGLSGEDVSFWEISGSGIEQHARVSPDGLWLAFMSDRGLTGYDTRDAVSGRPDEEVYLYNASANTLACASCDPTGARPVGFKARAIASFVPSWSQALHRFSGIASQVDQGYQSRYLSDSGRLFFDSEDGLVAQDVNGAEDVYEYEPEGVPAGEHACSGAVGGGSVVFKPARGFEVEGVKGEEGAGCVGLISSGISAQESSFLDASESGGDVFFLTTSRLVAQDVEGGFSVFDAHECTGASPCFAVPAVAPPACETEASCRVAPTPQPAIYGTPASATFSGSGNVVSPPPAPAAVKKTVRARKCPKGERAIRGKCKRKSGVRRGRKSKQADRKRGGK